jgi:PAS domain S-box-containing protein
MNMHRTMTLRTALLFLFSSLFLLLLLFGVAVLVYQWNHQRDLAYRQLRDEAISQRIAVEREISLDLAVLNTLAGLPEFDRQDWATLHATARLGSQTRPHSWIVVTDPDGQYVVNTALPQGSPLPNVRHMPSRPDSVPWQGRNIPFPPWRNFEQVFQTGQPFFTGLTYGPVVKGPVVAINAPVSREGKTRYAMSMAYSPDVYTKLLQTQPSGDQLVRVLVDRSGLIIGRSLGADHWVGRQGAKPFDRNVDSLPSEGIGETVNLEGTAVLYAFSRSTINGWTVGVGMPRERVLAPARRMLWIWTGFLVAIAVLGVFAVWRLWRKLATPLAALALQARKPNTRDLDTVSSGIQEIDALKTAMRDAAQNEQVRRQAEQERDRAEMRFRTVVESSPSGILMLNQQGQIHMVNRRIEAFFEYSRQELLGQSVDMLVPRRLHGGDFKLLSGYFSSAEKLPPGDTLDLIGRRKDGSEFPMQVGVIPVDTEEGPFALASVVDISLRKQTEEDLRRSNQDLEQFAYIASHDLQEPLRTMTHYTDLLAQHQQIRPDDQANQYVRRVGEAAKHMQEMIHGLLAFSRVGAESKLSTSVDARAVAHNVLQSMHTTITKSRTRIECGELPMVLAEESQLFQVFQNLIGNALKFRTEQPLHIQIDARLANGYWLFSVQDNGIGFDPQHAERIFQMYQRLHPRDQFDGNGIGLPIVKRIIEHHGGRVWAQSRQGMGSTFFFTLRAAESLPI